jgi:hypothetical protein
MRFFLLGSVCGLALLASAPALAHEVPEGAGTEAQHQEDEAGTRPRRHRSARPGRAWIGVGTGLVSGDVDIPCGGGTGGDCSESGVFQSYSANVTFAGEAALRFRGIRAEEETDRTPYETAALIGARFGRSNWYGLVGAGRIRHADDSFVGDARGFAWEILFAPSSRGPVGFELSFQGNNGRDVDFTAFNVGMRFGKLR